MVKYKVIQDPAVDDNVVLTLVNTEDNTEKLWQHLMSLHLMK